MSIAIRVIAAAAAAFAITVSASTSGAFPNSMVAVRAVNVTSETFPNSTVTASEVNVAGWEYQACVYNCNDTAFALVETSEIMTVERCLLDCSAYKFAAVHGDACYCSQGAYGIMVVDDGQCHLPCPGDSTEACGGQAGVAPTLRTKRSNLDSESQAEETSCSMTPGGNFYSVYQNTIVPKGVTYQTVITKVYEDHCPTCPGGTSTGTATSTATLTGCGCTNPVIPSIPMMTKTVQCDSCDYPSTFTVPYNTPSAYYKQPTTPTLSPEYPPVMSTYNVAPAIFTGVAVNVQAGFKMAGAVVAVLAVL